MPKRAELGSAKIRPQPWGKAGGPEDRKKASLFIFVFPLEMQIAFPERNHSQAHTPLIVKS